MPAETVISLLIAAAALLCSLWNVRRTANGDTSESAVARATLTADIKYIRSSVDDIRLDNKALQKDIGELKTQLVIVEQSVKSAHKRIDDMQKGA
jgi:peptidoglycan hydrolase CwlO-like protein